MKASFWPVWRCEGAGGGGGWWSEPVLDRGQRQSCRCICQTKLREHLLFPVRLISSVICTWQRLHTTANSRTVDSTQPIKEVLSLSSANERRVREGLSQFEPIKDEVSLSSANKRRVREDYLNWSQLKMRCLSSANKKRVREQDYLNWSQLKISGLSPQPIREECWSPSQLRKSQIFLTKLEYRCFHLSQWEKNYL